MPLYWVSFSVVGYKLEGVMRRIDRVAVKANDEQPGSNGFSGAFEKMQRGDSLLLVILSALDSAGFDACFPRVAPGDQTQFDERDLFEWCELPPRQVSVVVEAPGRIAGDCGWGVSEEDD